MFYRCYSISTHRIADLRCLIAASGANVQIGCERLVDHFIAVAKASETYVELEHTTDEFIQDELNGVLDDYDVRKYAAQLSRGAAATEFDRSSVCCDRGLPSA